MNSSISDQFMKQMTCPSSQMLLAYSASTLAWSQSQSIAAHLAACDFCDAELSLLCDHYSAEPEEDCPSIPMPLNLRCLAESLLGWTVPNMESLTSAAYEKEGLTLTDA